MSGRFKRCRSPSSGRVDSWLDSLGYYRKNVAYDETCLFRAVSEQLFETQSQHEKVRTDCIAYGMHNHQQFRHVINAEADWIDYLDRLRIHMIVCGSLEIELVSLTYDVDVLVFNALAMHMQDVTQRQKNKTILVCKMREDHYDVVYRKEQIITAGFCQSLVYKTLYQNVFKIGDTSSIVNSMLHERPSPYTVYYSKDRDSDSDGKEDLFLREKKTLMGVLNPAPFPFKVAKALDPNMYRNIEYDTWIEVRRELRLGDWYYGDDKLILGTRCLINYRGEELQCYIQEILRDENQCVVYVTKYATRCSVTYSDLKPEDNAKPWPLPYRFSRHLVICPNEKLSEEDTNTKTKRKREKKKSRSADTTHSSLGESFKDYEAGLLDSKNSTSTSGPKLDITSAVDSYDWNPSPVQLNPELPWPQTPPTSHPTFPNFENGNSALPPIIIPPQTVFSDSATTPIYYNYNPVSMWSTQEYASPVESNEFERNSPRVPNESYTTPQYQYHQQEAPLAMPTFVTTPSAYEEMLPSNPSIHTPLPITSPTIPMLATTPQMEMYPYVYPIPPPGTPVFLQAPPPPRQNVLIAQSPLPVYNPTVDVQYLSPPTYIYPPTPPTAWYSPGSQGFIFPTPLNPLGAQQGAQRF